MEIRHATNPKAAESYTTEELRNDFLIDHIFVDDQLCLTYTHYDRVIIGSAVPKQADLVLSELPELKTDYFLERREIGIVNIGEPGVVVVGEQQFELGNKDCLYVGMGTKEIKFVQGLGRFYLVSAPAHKTYPTQHVKLGESFNQKLGSPENSNERTLHRFIHQEGIQSCQLMLGMTELSPGSVWNTMPAHWHDRRMEVYLYFNLNQDARVFHFMGRPEETRHLVVANEQSVISPSWSIHSGAGTSNYSFIWAMAGENYTFTDMDMVGMSELR